MCGGKTMLMSWVSTVVKCVERLGCFFSLFLFLALGIESLLGNEETFSNVRVEVSNFRRDHGRAPNDEDFFSIIAKNRNCLTAHEQITIWKDIVKQQKPEIDINAIVKLYQAKRDSIRDYESKFTVNRKKNDGSLETKVVIHALKDRKFYLNTEFVSGNQPKGNVLSYDGEYLFRIKDVHDSPFASIAMLELRSLAFNDENPLAQSMLYDTELAGFEHRFFDMVNNLPRAKDSVVFEHEEIVDGVSCIVVADFSQRCFFDKQNSYSLKKIQRFNTTSTGTAIGDVLDGGRILTFQRELFDTKDFANGIVLPYRCVNKFFDDRGLPTSEKIIDVEFINVNSGLEDSYFSDIIPDGIPVVDGVLGLVYNSDDRPSIDTTLKRVAKSKRVWTFQIVSVTLGIIMIIIALIMMYLKRRNAA
jgi:hypothetical protein